MTMTETIEQPSLAEMATELTAAWLGNVHTRCDQEQAAEFLRSMHTSLVELTSVPDEPVEERASTFIPAVSVRKSLASNDYILSMIDGKPYRTLRRHLATHGLTPDQYRERYGLKPDYPMTCVSYSEARRQTAIKNGLGRKPVTKRKPKAK